MIIEQIPPSDLKPFPKNSRTHDAKQITAIGRALTQWGFLQPIVIDEVSTILVGHGRVEAAKEIGLATVPCVRRTGLSPEQKSALVISDNRLAELSKWDADTLDDELRFLLGAKFDLTLTTRDLPEPKPIRSVAEIDKPDPVSVSGDAWLFGTSILLCGDAGQPGPLTTALAFGDPDLLVTTAPAAGEPAENEARLSRALAACGAPVAYVWHQAASTGRTGAAVEAVGYDLRAQIILRFPDVKGKGKGHYGSAFEPCWYGVLAGKTADWRGGRSQTTVWEEDDLVDDTSRPVIRGRALRRPITSHTERGAIVFDPFSGNGDTMIAAVATGRRCIAIEKSARGVDETIVRWENFTGKDAIHGSGKTYSEIRENRKAAPASG